MGGDKKTKKAGRAGARRGAREGVVMGKEKKRRSK